MSQSAESSSLCRALRKQIIPWIERWGMEKIVVAAPSYRELQARSEGLPDGVVVRYRPLRGKREPERSHVYGSASVVNARWPLDNLQTTRTPKLCLVLQGSVAYPVADYQLILKAGHGLLLPPGVPFALQLNQEYFEFHPGMEQCDIFQLLPYQNSLNCWISTKSLDAKKKFSNRADVVSVLHSKVPEYLQNITSEALERRPLHEKTCRSWLQLLVYELYRELQDALVVKATSREALIVGKKHRAGLETAPVVEREAPMAQAQKYIRIHLASGVSIDNVADYICMSRTVFTEKFRLHTGMSFTAYVTQLRLQEAQTLLKETDLSISQICKTLGITPAWLRKLFQEQLLLSPTQYRERCRQEDTMRPKIAHSGQKLR